MLRLCELVREMAKKGRGTIREQEVLACFGTNKEAFLPAPCLVELPSSVIETCDSRNLAELLTKPDTRKVLVHGEAGVGKSVTAGTVGELLPPGSVTVVYDCYAGGKTGTPDKYRFPESVLCTQVVNELAVSVGQYIYLVGPNPHQADAWGALQLAINKAAEKLQARDAYLVLVIDAADNAAEAYDRYRDYSDRRSFLPTMWGISLPDNARLVFTCRTFRKPKLNAPDDVAELQLTGFSEAHSLEHLRGGFPQADEAVGGEFHRKTYGVPRHQDYWLAELTQQSDDAAFQEIRDRPSFGLNELYRDWLSSAQTALPSKVPCKKMLAILRASANPVSLPVVSGCLGVDKSSTLEFCQGLGPGVLLDSEQSELRFRDEDYEAFLDNQIDDKDRCSAHSALAEHCLRTLETEKYSARYACTHLFEAGRDAELLSVVLLGQSGLDLLSDPIEKARCEQERINLAFKSAARRSDSCSALKLLFEVGRVNRTESLLGGILVEYPSLAIRHHSLQMLEQSLPVHLDDAGEGRIYFHFAKELTEDSSQKEVAEKALEKAVAWLRMHIIRAQDDRHWHRFDYEVDDSVAYAIAALNLYGPRAARQTLRRWVNRKTQLQSVYRFFKRIGQDSGSRRTLRTYRNCAAVAVARAAAISGMFEVRITPGKAEVVSVARRLKAWLIKYGYKYDVIDAWIVSFVEAAALSGTPRDILVDIVRLLRLPNSQRLYNRLTASQWHGELDNYTRFVAFKCVLKDTQLTIETVFPDDCARIKSESPSYDREHSVLKQIAAILPVYEIGARAAIDGYSVGKITKKLNPLINTWSEPARNHWDRYEPLYEVFVLNAIRMIVHARGAAAHDLIDRLMALSEGVMGYKPVELYTSVADALSHHDEYQDQAVEIIGKVRSSWCKMNDLRASVATRRLMECAQILLRIDTELSKEYFDKAMEAASGVDEDASVLVKAIANITKHCIGETSSETRSRLAVDLASLIEKYWPMMEEDERIPWGTYVQALASLDSSVGFSTAFDLDDKGRTRLSEVAKELASGLADGKQVAVTYASCLHCFGVVDSAYVESSLRALSDIHGSNATAAGRLFRTVARNIMLKASMGERPSACEMLIGWGNKHGMSSGIIREMEECRDFYTNTDNWSPSSDSQAMIPRDGRDPEKRFLVRINKTKAASIAMLPAVLGDDDLSANSLHTVLMAMAGHMRGRHRVDFLQSLVSHQPIYYLNCREAIPRTLAQLIRQWITSPGVSTWARDSIPIYFEEHLYGLFGYNAVFPQAGIDLIEALDLTNGEKMLVLLPSLARHGHKFSAQVAYEMAGVLACYMPEISLEEIAIGLLEQGGHRTPETHADREGDGLAAFLYWCFEQPDNRIRWQASHAARHMLCLQPEPLLSELVDLSFSNIRQMWMSAREWMLFLFLHLAQKAPEAMRPHAARIYEHALDESFPHAGLQEIAKRTLLVLHDHGMATLTREQEECLHMLNEPKQTLWPRGERCVKSVQESKSHPPWRFHFDWADTLPYWYSPLGHCFGLHRCDVADRAERWICDHWHMTNADCHQYSRRRERDRDYNLFSHRHGSHPTIETLSTYIERHAMHMAAGEMIRELPIVSVNPEEYGSWHNWISRHCFDADPLITSDLLAPVPLQRFFHGIAPEAITSSSVLPSSAFSAHLVGQVAGTDSRWIVVSGHYTAAITDYSITVHIESALVTPCAARALARAMLSAEHSQDIPIPELRVSYEHNVEDIEEQLRQAKEQELRNFEAVSVTGFDLLPFTAEYYTERDMHAMDQKWPGLSRSWHIPIRDFVTRIQLKRVPGQLCFMNNHEELVVVPESWKDSRYNHGHRQNGSNGNRLNIRQGDIHAYLKQVNKDLLIRISIRRNADARDASGEYDHGQANIFILRKSGRIERMGRDCSTRQENCQGT